MNIFANIIYTNEENIKNEILKTLNLNLKEKTSNLEIYSKLKVDANLVLIFGKNIDEIIKYSLENYEIIKFFNIWTSLPLDDLDLILWDIMIPNTFINEKNEALFLEYLVDKNYNLKNFWLILNWICLSLESYITDKRQLQEIREKFSAEIFDKESYKIVKTLEKKDLLSKSCIIKIIWKNEEFIKNWVQILELMI